MRQTFDELHALARDILAEVRAKSDDNDELPILRALVAVQQRSALETFAEVEAMLLKGKPLQLVKGDTL